MVEAFIFIFIKVTGIRKIHEQPDIMHSCPDIMTSQDLPEHFEDNMELWMKNFLILLTTEVPGIEVRLFKKLLSNIPVY